MRSQGGAGANANEGRAKIAGKGNDAPRNAKQIDGKHQSRYVDREFET
jgi:hypothetical protein